MTYLIGANPYQGLMTKAQYLRKGMSPGARCSVVGPNGDTKEFVAVKLSAATWINGIAVIIDGLSSADPQAPVATASGAPAAAINARLGILTFASATVTQTMAGTAFGWAQIYGRAIAWVSSGPSAPGLQLAIGASGQLIQASAQASASAATWGITAIATASTTTGSANLLMVFLNYPKFSGLPDANLA